jgi:prepilin-type N-terminal cleavage/methylation domain-containing protein
MILRALKRIHKDQKGFTLIEVLVVMTILGILAAIVSISLLGVTASARQKAKDAEKQTVQAALDAMLSDQQAASNNTGCDGSLHNNMTIFPLNTAYTTQGTGNPTALSTHYLREGRTQYLYSCDASGNITQGGLGPQPPNAPQ